MTIQDLRSHIVGCTVLCGNKCRLCLRLANRGQKKELGSTIPRHQDKHTHPCLTGSKRIMCSALTLFCTEDGQKILYILIELIDLARDRKAWNQTYGHLSYQDRREYYRRRADRFKKQSRRGDSDESRVQREDEPTPNNQARVAERQVRHLGKGPGIAAATRAPTAGPEPETKFSEFWQFREMARWGYPSVPDLLQGTESENLPYQLGAPDGAAGSSTDTQLVQAVPHPKEEIFECLQCGEPSALTNLWQCNRCSRMMGKAVCFHCPSRYKNCYSAHAHYCESQSLFGWRRTQQKR